MAAREPTPELDRRYGAPDAVRPTKVIAFAKGDFAQTRYRFR
jgi:hypothetical protein